MARRHVPARRPGGERPPAPVGVRRRRHPADRAGHAARRRREARLLTVDVSPIGRLGDEILVHGTYDPYVEVADRLVRLRLLNASTARIYDIGFADGREWDLMGPDGGLLEAPERISRVQLSVGERAEIVVELEAGEDAVVRSFEPELGTNAFEARFAGADDSLDLLAIRAALKATPAHPAAANNDCSRSHAIKRWPTTKFS